MNDTILEPKTIILRISLALFFSGIIGLERGHKNQAAGPRTYMLVCLGSAVVMMTNQYGCFLFHTGDPLRLGAQVISGIGFLGAGTIIVTAKNQIRGLTTAAGLWSAACLGLAIGLGFYQGSIAAGITILLIMSVFQKIESLFGFQSPYSKFYINFTSSSALNEFLCLCHKNAISVEDIQFYEFDASMIAMVTIHKSKKAVLTEFINNLYEIEGLKYIEEL